MENQEDHFFATQINSHQPQPLESNPVQEHADPHVAQQQPPVEAQNDDLSLKSLLAAFNSYDKEEKGLITLLDAEQLLKSKNILCESIKECHTMSLPIYPDLITFDQFLFVLSIQEHHHFNIQEKYALLKKVDPRLIQFLKLLNNYRKKCQKAGHYTEAKKSKKKIQEIRSRQLNRRNKYLNILHQSEMQDLEEKQKSKFVEFCETWDNFMNEYESTASELIKRLKEKHEQELVEFEIKTKEQLSSKMHFSKYLLELQVKEKNLVKMQEYEKASLIQQEIEDVKIEEVKQKEYSDLEVLELRMSSVRKQQHATINTLLQKIQKDRNDHMKQRQGDSEKLIVRNKSLMNEINHKHSEALKKIYEALNNLGLDSEKSIKVSQEKSPKP